VDARQLIAREVVGNILIHRDYSNAFPAKLIIDREALYTENWSKSRFNGPLSIENFSPYPKNPLLSAFFVNIGRADTLGSGMRNLYKYTKLYSRTEPVLREGDVFETWISLHPEANVKLIEANRDANMKLIMMLMTRNCLIRYWIASKTIHILPR
jgi:ATP-dependent DNA helicase RecG